MPAKIRGHTWTGTIHGRGRPVLFLPDGPTLSYPYFCPWLDGLGEQVQLIYCDYENNNPEAGLENETSFNLTGWLAEIEALRICLGHARLILFGHAFGGWLAHEYALRYSDRLAGLILCETILNLDEPNLNRLDELVTPTLIIAGRHNQVALPLQAECLHALLLNSKLVILDESSYFPFCQDQAKFLTVVADWLATLD